MKVFALCGWAVHSVRVTFLLRISRAMPAGFDFGAIDLLARWRARNRDGPPLSLSVSFGFSGPPHGGPFYWLEVTPGESGKAPLTFRNSAGLLQGHRHRDTFIESEMGAA